MDGEPAAGPGGEAGAPAAAVRAPAGSARKAVIFLRHGESEYNRAVRETGKDPLIRDAPLTEVGRAQATAAQGTLAALRARAEVGSSDRRWLLVVSPLRRALDTAAGAWPEAFFRGAGSDSLGGSMETNGVRIEVWPELREAVCGCDDLGTSPRGLAVAYPHLAAQFARLPEVWWTVPADLRHLPADGDAMREAYIRDPQAFEDAEDAAMDSRLQALSLRLGSVPEEQVVVVAHCNLIGQLTELLGLNEARDDGSRRGGWWLGNCECRIAEALEVWTRTGEGAERQLKQLANS